MEIIRGYENCFRKDFPLKANVQFELGEWGVLNASGEIEKATATPSFMSYLLLTGTDRFDVKASGKVTVVQNSDLVVRTTLFDNTTPLAVGDALTVKLVAGKSVLTKQAGAEPIFARVVKVSSNSLEYEVVRP